MALSESGLVVSRPTYTQLASISTNSVTELVPHNKQRQPPRKTTVEIRNKYTGRLFKLEI